MSLLMNLRLNKDNLIIPFESLSLGTYTHLEFETIISGILESNILGKMEFLNCQVLDILCGESTDVSYPPCEECLLATEIKD